LPITTHHPPFSTHPPTTNHKPPTKSCKTNPNCTNPQMNVSPVRTMNYEQIAMNNAAKANPSKPKQSQSDPHFSPVMAPQTQNKPKQTQFPVKLGKPDQAAQPYPLRRRTPSCRASMVIQRRCLVTVPLAQAGKKSSLLFTIRRHLTNVRRSFTIKSERKKGTKLILHVPPKTARGQGGQM